MTLGLLLCLVGHWMLVLGWYYQINFKYCDFRLIDSFAIIGLSQFVKYLPGNVAHIVGRGYLARRLLSQKDVYISLLVETLLIAFLALFLGAFWFTNVVDNWWSNENWDRVFVVGMGICVICIGMYVIRRFARYLLDIRLIGSLCGLYLVSYVLHGLIILLVFKYILGIEEVALWQCVSGFAFAFVLGYVLPGAPGGLGVREYAFVMLFGFAVGELAAMQAILMHRLLTVISDVLLFLAASYSRKYSQIN